LLDVETLSVTLLYGIVSELACVSNPGGLGAPDDDIDGIGPEFLALLDRLSPSI
jgi:hypothetical protein